MESKPLRIDAWGINYHPEPIGIATYTTQMCEYLAAKGFLVRATTGFPYYPQWRKLQPGIFTSETISGVPVRRNWLYVPPQANTIRRIVHEASFACTSFIRQLFSPRQDAYIVVSPPLLLGLCAVIISRLKRAPFIFYVQDLQPDAAISLGMIKQGWLVKIALFIEALVYANASMIIAISPEMSEAIANKGVPASKILTIPNWISDQGYLRPREKNSWKQRHGIAPDTRVVSYCGNIGVKQDLESVVEAAELIKADPTIQIVICGDGTQKEKLKEIIEAKQLKNVSLLPVLSSDDFWALLLDSDLCLVTLRPKTGASFLPSKLLNILAAGKPVLTNADAESALHHAVSNGNFGVVVDQGPQPLAQAISELLAQPTRMTAMAERGKEYVKQYQKEVILDALIARLAAICAPRGTAVSDLEKDHARQ